MPIELITGVVGFLFTLMIFSYLIGDNPVFRFASYLFVGVASGYAAAVVCYQLLLPRLQSLPLNDPTQLLIGFIPFFLAVTLLAKLMPRISWIGSFATAVLVGVGAATAFGGALIGTLIPQVQAVSDAFDPFVVLSFHQLEGVAMLLGTIVTLAYFQFGAKRSIDGTVKRNAIVELLARVGRVFIAVTLGAFFAGVYMAALTAMIERIGSSINVVKSVLGL